MVQAHYSEDRGQHERSDQPKHPARAGMIENPAEDYRRHHAADRKRGREEAKHFARRSLRRDSAHHEVTAGLHNTGAHSGYREQSGEHHDRQWQ